jgi:hypothetical protein
MSEQLPVKKDEVDDLIDKATDAYLRAERIIEAINANLPEGARRLTPIPKEYVFKKVDRETVSVAFHAAFQMAGGVSRFAQWAQDEPDKFYQLYAKLLPSNTETPAGNFNFNFSTLVPETRQDRMMIDETGKVIEAEVDDLPE